MFEWIGRISDYTATWKLKKEANYRIKTGQAISLTDSKKQMAEEARQKRPQNVGTIAKVTDATRLAIISQKARGGKKLTPEEMRLLKENDEALYQKAKKADDAREELKAALKRARTKEAARRILMEAQLKVAIEAIESAKGGAGGLPSGGGAGSASGAASTGEAGAAVKADGAAAAPEAGAASFEGEGAPALAGGTATGAASAAPASAADAANAGHGAQADAPGTEAGNAVGTDHSDGRAEKDAAHDGKTHGEGEKKPSFLEERLAELKANYSRAMEQLDEAKNAKVDFDDTFLIVLRALADEWREFTSSKAWEKLPENEREAKLRGRHGGAGDYGRRGADPLLALANSYKITGKEEMPPLVDLIAHTDVAASGAGMRKIGGTDAKI